MAEGIDPAMNAVQAAALQPPRDRAAAEARVSQLLSADHAVLCFNNPPQSFCIDFHPTGGRNPTQNEHDPMLAPEMCRDAHVAGLSLPKLCRDTAGLDSKA